MAMFEGRQTGYKVGALLILTGTALSMVGILAPGWLTFHNRPPDNLTAAGLFVECAADTSCGLMNVMQIEGYEKWSHVILSMGVVALLISSLFIVIFNCVVTGASSRWKVVEGCHVYGGFFLFIGIVNYVANDTHQSRTSYGYAFFLTVLASVIAVTGGILVALANKSPSDVIGDSEGRVVQPKQRYISSTLSGDAPL